MPPDSNREAWPGTWAMVPLGPAARAPSPSVPHCQACLAVLTRPASSGPVPQGCGCWRRWGVLEAEWEVWGPDGLRAGDLWLEERVP